MKENRERTLSRHAREHEQLSSHSAGNHGNPVMAFISGMGLGAGIMYVLDPDRGNRRRAMAQQKLYRLFRQAGDGFDKGIRDLEHRFEGIVSEAGSLFRSEEITDDVLEQRVRAKLGRVASHPGAIEVRSRDSEVTLSGPVLRGEMETIRRAVRHVRGVRAVDCRLEEHSSSEDLPGLQGPGHRPGDTPELLQENWAPGTRLVMGSAGLLLMTQGVRRPGLLHTLWGVAGLLLVARSARGSRLMGTVSEALRPAAGPRTGHREQSEHEIGGGVRRRRSAVDIERVLNAREIPRPEWKSALDQLSRVLEGCPATVEVQDGVNRRVEQHDQPLDGIGADVKDRESTVNVVVGQNAKTQVTHSIRANAVRLRDDGDAKLLEIDSVDGPKTIVRFRKSDVRSIHAA